MNQLLGAGNEVLQYPSGLAATLLIVLITFGAVPHHLRSVLVQRLIPPLLPASLSRGNAAPVLRSEPLPVIRTASDMSSSRETI
jgi:hypothetical protein